MRLRYFVFASALTTLIAVPVFAQTTSAPAKAAGTAKPAAAARTADGHPNLQGVWTFATLTPLERPAAFAGKAVLTNEELAQAAKERLEGQACIEHPSPNCNTDKIRPQKGTEEDVSEAYNEAWFERGKMLNQTSLIVDPPDGKLPALTELAKQRNAARAAARNRPARGPEDRSLGERCILGFNSGPPMVPGGYNQNVQIFQTKDTVVLLNEMVHNARIIPLDGRPHGAVHQWVGDSRGHWEGNTLVVDTINFTDEGTSLRVPTDKNYHLIERFTLRDGDTLSYEFTVDDPTILTRPFTASFPMSRRNEPIYEYACHEGNYGMFGILAGARAQESETAAKSGLK